MSSTKCSRTLARMSSRPIDSEWSSMPRKLKTFFSDGTGFFVKSSKTKSSSESLRTRSSRCKRLTDIRSLLLCVQAFVRAAWAIR